MNKSGQVKQIDRVISQFLQEEEAGRDPDPAEWLVRYPDIQAELADFFSNHQALNKQSPDKGDEQATVSFEERRTSGGESHECGPDFVRPGEVVGDCRLVRKLGQGGMGIVYLGRHIRLCDHRAVKLLPQSQVTDDMITRFWREARIAASIHHPNVVDVHDVGKDRDRHYIVMEYVEGQNLSQLHRSEAANSSKKHFSWQRALKLVAPVLEALQVVHQRDIVHRDIKPSNIMVSRASSASTRSRVVLMDFGLVQKELDSGEITQLGAIVGTPAFMSPEQAKGWEIDGRSDIYSLGATLYALLTGRSPYKGPKNLILGQIATGTPPNSLESLCPDLPKEVVSLVNNAMASDRERRYADANTMLKELVRVLRSSSRQPSTPPLAPRERARASRVPAETKPPPKTSPLSQIPLELVETEPIASAQSPTLATPMTVPVPSASNASEDRVVFGVPLKPATTTQLATFATIGIVGLALFIGSTLNPESSVRNESAPASSSPLKSPGKSQAAMVRIPSGTVQLGETEERMREHLARWDLARDDPTLTNQIVAAYQDEEYEIVPVPAFQIDKYEVTNEEYARFVQSTGHSPPSHWNGDNNPPTGLEDHPVVNVSYYDATEYAAWAGKSLPTVAQWTRAFRGDDSRMYPWGDTWEPDRANVSENPTFPLDTIPVTASPRDVSPFGVCNLVGNVREILQKRVVANGVPMSVLKGSNAGATGRIYGCGPMQVFCDDPSLAQPLTGFRCVRKE